MLCLLVIRTSSTNGENGEIIEPNAEAIKMNQERPKTYLRASRTYAEQEADREKWNHRNSKSYLQRQEVNQSIKKQRISQEHFNQLEVDEDEEHDTNKYGCPPPPPPPPEPKVTNSPDDAEEEDDPADITLGKKDNEEDEDQNSYHSFESAKGSDDEKIDKDIQKKNKSLKDSKVTKIASELHQK